MSHIREKFFYRESSSLSNKLLVGSTLKIIQRESKKTISKADLKKKFYNVSHIKER